MLNYLETFCIQVVRVLNYFPCYHSEALLMKIPYLKWT